MATNIVPTLRAALHRLETEKARLDRQVAALRTALSATGGTTSPVRRRKPMSAADRKAIGRRMKAYWAKRKAPKKK
ncbi:MAG: hypothetical protein HY654_13830 [Acidobacteria bacterium]|nr:hypothetical protein [Acidobacteriota bacterium]